MTRRILLALALVLGIIPLSGQEYYPGGGGGSGGAASSLSGTGATVLVSTPVVNVSQTWNAGAVVFTGIKENITNTASSVNSLLLDMQVGTTPFAQVARTGHFYSGDTSINNGGYHFGNLTGAGTTTDLLSNAAGTLKVASSFNGGVNQGGTLLLGTADDASGIQLINPGSAQRLWFRAGAGGTVRVEVHRLKVVDPGGAVQGGLMINGATPTISNFVPTFSSGFGTSPSLLTGTSGSFAFRWNVGTGGTATNGVITVGTADNGWNCSVNNLTAAAGHRADNTVQTASTASTITIENQTKSTGAAVAWTASDTIALVCAGF